jgi:penicillin amidase
MADTQDLFLERAVAGGAAVERAGGAPEPVRLRVEAIGVRGRAEPERLAVRETTNGVVLNDIVARPAGTPQDFPAWQGPHLLTLRSSLEVPDGALAALYRINRAMSVEALIEAAQGVRHAAQKLMYAHRDGQVGWVMTGALPVRQGSAGAFPVPAWLGGYGWLRHFPAGHNPAVAGAGSQGFLVAANDRALPADYPGHVGSSWQPPYRALRIRELLEGARRLGPEDLAAIQGDVRSLEAARYQQALARLAPELGVLDPHAWAIARDALLQWDARLDPESASGAFLVLLRPRLAEAIFGDELGEDLSDLMAISALAHNFLQEVVAGGHSSFWDDLRTPEVERPAQIWARALHRTGAALAERFGSPPAARLEAVRSLVFAHAFHWVPGLGPLFDGRALGVGGDDHTVSAMKATLLEPGRSMFVPSYRAVIAPGDWRRSRGTNTLGQSGHRFSPHRADQLRDWRGGRTHPWSWEGPGPGRVRGQLVLVPEGTPP